MYGGKTSISRLPVKSSLLEVPSSSTRDSRSIRPRASSTSRVSGLSNGESPAFRRSKSSQSLYRTPQSVLRHGSRLRSTERSKHKKKDSRPLHDKKWQQQQITKTQAYFKNVPGGSEILNKGTNLRPMTLNMFVELCNLVLTNIDPCLDELRLANYTDLLPTYLTLLMYPGTVTTSMLKTANTMHSWPHVLGILSWLVELDELHDVPVEDMLFEIPDDAPPPYKSDKYSWGIVVDTFVAWNAQELNENNLVKDYEEGMKIIHDIPVGLANKLREEINKKKEYHLELKERLEGKRNLLKESRDELKCIKHDYHDAKAKYAQQKNYNKRVKDVIVDSKNDIEKLKKAIEKARNNNEKLKEKIAKQPMTKRERDENLILIEDLKAKKELIQKTHLHRQTISNEKDLKLSQLKRHLEQKINTHNISLIKPTLAHPALKELSLPQDGFLRPDMKNLIGEKLQKKKALKTQLQKENDHLDHEVSVIKTKVENTQRELDDLLVIKDKRKKTNEELKIKLSNMKKTAHVQDRITQSKIEQLKEEIKELSSAVENPEYKKFVPILKTHNDKCTGWENRIKEKMEESVQFFTNLEKHVNNDIPKLKGFRTVVDKTINETTAIISEPKFENDSDEKKNIE